MKKLAISVLCFVLGAGIMHTVIEAGRADAAPVAYAQASAPVTVEPFAGSAVVAPAPVAVPDPVAEPLESASLVWKLYKAGHLIPAIIVLAFCLLLVLQKWVAWLRTGYRKLLVASVLAGLTMLVERAANGETPNLMMAMGAIGAALTLYMKGEGESA